MINYKLTITQRGEGADKEFKNIITCSDPVSVYKALARCYRDINKGERARAIIRAKHWIANLYDSEKRKHCFTIEYDVHSDHSIITVYNWEFEGVDND